MSKFKPEKQQKLHDVIGQLSDQYVMESREDNLPEQKTKKSHPVLRWVAVAAAALLMLGVIFTASVMGNIAWKKNHPDTGETPVPGGSTGPADSGVVPGAALSDAGFDRERGVYVLSEAWADYAENVCGGTLSPDNVYAFALALQKTGQPVETERNIFVNRFVSSFSRDFFENADSITGTVVFRPTDGAPAFGTPERDTYLYFLATLTNCLADHVYYSDNTFDLAYHNRYPKSCFDFSVDDYAGGFQKAAEEDSTKINLNRVYRVYFDRLAVYGGEDWKTDYYLKMRRELVEVPEAVAAYSHLDVSSGVDMYFGAMANHLYYCILVARNDSRQEEIRENFMLGLLPAKSELTGAAPWLNLAQAAAVLASFNLQPEDVRLIYQPIMISSYIGFPGEIEADVIETFGSAYLESLINNSVILGQG